MARVYNDPAGGTPSQIGSQVRTDHYVKKALIEARRLQYFMPLADVTSMPKHMGKKIKKYHYLPLLDDANINDQGLDAAGAVLTTTEFDVVFPALTGNPVRTAAEASATAIAAINDNIHNAGAALVIAADGAGETVDIDQNSNTDLVIRYETEAKADAVVAEVQGTYKVQRSGNLYGSSKDIGLIPGKLPTLTENGGRVNRVGFKRVEVEGSIEKFGFFDEYTQESVDFDSDADLLMHINREMINGATEITEDALQVDLLNSAGVVRYAGNATSNVTLDAADVVDYSDLLHLSIDLDNNRTPKQTKVSTGTRLVDTMTIPAARVLYCGSELIPTLEAMTDLHSAQAFIPVQKYAAGTSVLNGEIGTISHFRIVVVPEMQKWAGAGADASGTATHYETNDQYDVFPMLCVGDGSFTTIGFQTDGKTVKFKIYHKKPGEATADRNDPYGETGFMSIKWYYGFLLQRSERIGLIKTTATL